ncbi:MAG TPA: T9SS type A sorting domain-containing protein [Flavobacteriales bacterium]
MKNFYLKLISSLLFVLCFHAAVFAQCEECTPDMTCGQGMNFPAVCPLEAQDATAGEYYEQTLTFFIPNSFVDPQSNLTVTLLSVEIVSVTGLPFGLEYTLNDSDGVYYPSQGQNYGCATVCGIPLIPGTYDVLITVTGVVSAFGLEIEQTESFSSIITVLPGEGATATFVYDNLAGCGSLEVNYEATIVAPEPAITSYSWDFGNGQTSTSPNPPTVLYESEGTYPVSLTTTIEQHVLQSVTLNSVTTSGWITDEDILDQSPDPYFVLLNSEGVTVYTSSVASNSQTYTWSGLNILLDNPPYTIRFFDDDLITSDDELGSMSIALQTGAISINAGNGTTGQINIGLQVTNELVDDVEVIVFPIPDPEFTVNGNVLSCNDQSLFMYTWYRNGMPIPGQNGPTLTMTEGGQYYCEVQSAFGCVATSMSYLYCPAVVISYDALAMELEVPNVYDTYQWYYNGEPIPGATTFYVLAELPGEYHVVVTTTYGCHLTSEQYNLMVGVQEHDSLLYRIYPNPVESELTIQRVESGAEQTLRIVDALGKAVLYQLISSGATTIAVDMSSLSPGIYVVELGNAKTRLVKK